jgi:hypothetical protein
MPPDIPTDLDAGRRRIDAELAQIEFTLPGSITTRIVTCGRATCRCATDPEQRHGPYIQWSRTVKGGTVDKMLTPQRLDRRTRVLGRRPGQCDATDQHHCLANLVNRVVGARRIAAANRSYSIVTEPAGAAMGQLQRGSAVSVGCPAKVSSCPLDQPSTVRTAGRFEGSTLSRWLLPGPRRTRV